MSRRAASRHQSSRERRRPPPPPPSSTGWPDSTNTRWRHRRPTGGSSRPETGRKSCWGDAPPTSPYEGVIARPPAPRHHADRHQHRARRMQPIHSLGGQPTTLRVRHERSRHSGGDAFGHAEGVAPDRALAARPGPPAPPLPAGPPSPDKHSAFYNVARGAPGRCPDGPGRAMASLVGGMLGIRVDYVAATTFGGFTRLVDAMGGVGINLPSAIVDPHYQITQTQIG